ncbi:hypothetical protein J7F01_33660 [Streptomyces sp. ISL-22]|nr:MULTISPECIES: hypothetical protein [unclassified Streptomyces]MBT2421651.1 hypothetical protein [Streptomyces sp. ISL-24]MBT2437019.1 hypothetical protein [Streptomyces sp. ISL-22]
MPLVRRAPRATATAVAVAVAVAVDSITPPVAAKHAPAGSHPVSAPAAAAPASTPRVDGRVDPGDGPDPGIGRGGLVGDEIRGGDQRGDEEPGDRHGQGEGAQPLGQPGTAQRQPQSGRLPRQPGPGGGPPGDGPVEQPAHGASGGQGGEHPGRAAVAVALFLGEDHHQQLDHAQREAGPRGGDDRPPEPARHPPFGRTPPRLSAAGRHRPRLAAWCRRPLRPRPYGEDAGTHSRAGRAKGLRPA